MVFREDGHLSDGALEALAGNEDRFDELERLEITVGEAFCVWPGDLVTLRRTGWSWTSSGGSRPAHNGTRENVRRRCVRRYNRSKKSALEPMSLR